MQIIVFIPKAKLGISNSRVSTVGGIRAGGSIIAQNVVTGIQINGQDGFQVAVDAPHLIDFLAGELAKTPKVKHFLDLAHNAIDSENIGDLLYNIERAVQSSEDDQTG